LINLNKKTTDESKQNEEDEKDRELSAKSGVEKEVWELKKNLTEKELDSSDVSPVKKNQTERFVKEENSNNSPSKPPLVPHKRNEGINDNED
jgi:hypothetical protein